VEVRLEVRRMEMECGSRERRMGKGKKKIRRRMREREREREREMQKKCAFLRLTQIDEVSSLRAVILNERLR
jgi:hypothetical protein